MLPSGSANLTRAAAIACFTAVSPSSRTENRVAAVPAWLAQNSAKSECVRVNSISVASSTDNPAPRIVSNNFSGGESENGPSNFGGVVNNLRTAAPITEKSECSGDAKHAMPIGAPCFVTRASSRSARTGSSVNCSELIATAPSNRPSANGKFSVSATVKAASGNRACANASISAATSVPVTRAPRPRAKTHAPPAPQPASKMCVPLCATRASSHSANGMLYASCRSAQSAALGPQSSACRAPDDI